MNKREAQIICQKVISVLQQEQEGRGITNYMIAKKSGISESTLSYIKNTNQNPQLLTIVMMSAAIGIPLSKVFKLAEEDIDKQKPLG
mgnify:CR=1 FL=1